ncbi:MAG: DUF4907 domain-containing protein [Siphonobacter sp.]
MQKKRFNLLILVVILAAAIGIYLWKPRISKQEALAPQVDTPHMIADSAAAYQVTPFKSGRGWGYQIEQNGQAFIYQQYMPAFPGKQPFATAELAKKAGEIVLNKIKTGQVPPSLSKQELLDIGVQAP